MTDPKMTQVDKDRLRNIVDRTAHIKRRVQGGSSVAAHPPVGVIVNMINDRPPPLPELESVVTHPRFTPTGRLLATDGYDDETKTLLVLPERLRNLSIPPAPTDEDVNRSLAIIADLVCDFPFASEADRVNAIAKLLDPFTRGIHGAVTPPYVVSAPAAGTGKSKLIDALTIPVTGGEMQHATFPDNEAEVRKMFTSFLLAGVSHLCFDNFEGTLKSPTFSAFVTSLIWTDRILGLSRIADLPQRVNLSVSGNNVLFGGDIARRVVMIRLDAKMARPQLRRGFRHEPIEDWVKENQRPIVEACLTIVQHWVANGMQPGSVYKGSFEKWARVTSGILELVGMEGLDSNREEVDDVSDIEADGWLSFVNAWEQLYGVEEVSPSQLVNVLDHIDSPPFYVGDATSPFAVAIRVGKALNKVKDRIFNDFAITYSRTNTSSGSRLWKLVSTKDTGHLMAA